MTFHDSSSTDPKLGTLSTSTTGATMNNRYMARTQELYAVSEADLENIGTHNGLTANRLFWGGAFLGLGAGILTNAAFVPAAQMPPAGILARNLVAPSFLVLAAIFLIGAWRAHGKRNQLWGRITKQDGGGDASG